MEHIAQEYVREPSVHETTRDYVRSYHRKLVERVWQAQSGVEIAKDHARAFDGLLGALYCAARATATVHFGLNERVALVAVGGYGRGFLGLYSDLDLVFLCENPNNTAIASLAERVLYPLWDAGVEVGHAVRGVEETLNLARQDIRTATTLLDARWVAGDANLVEELKTQGLARVLEPTLSDFLDLLQAGLEERHRRFGGSLYLLEPEIKLGKGGLRDIDVALWAVGARWGATQLDELVRRGALLMREAKALEDAQSLEWTLRNQLHVRARRKQDRLTFEDQEESARALLFKDGDTLGVEQFMQQFYQHARGVSQLVERALTRARPLQRKSVAATEELGKGLLLFDGLVTFKESSDLQTDPTLSLRLYAEAVQRESRPYPYARDAIAKVAGESDWQEKLRSEPEANALFVQLMTHAAETAFPFGSILTELHEVGLFLALLPEFEPVTGRVQHDVYHLYTVDVHSIAALDRLRALCRGEFATEYPLASTLAAEAPRRLPLYLGVLLHDVGKAHGKNHSQVGAEIAVQVSKRLGLNEADVEHIRWLVLEHLSLYHWATRRDISDPDTLAEIARHVGSLERLRDLYLLTVVDVSTTNPNAMTSWKARMLDELYLSVQYLLAEQPKSQKSRVEMLRKEVEIGFIGDAYEAELRKFLTQMPDRYFLSNPVDVIRAHARRAHEFKSDALGMLLRPGPTAELTELLLWCKDRPGLLADIAAAFSLHRINVVSAQVYTRTIEDDQQQAFDVFYVRHENPQVLVIPDEVWHKFRRDLEALAEGTLSAHALTQRFAHRPLWSHKHIPSVRTKVYIDNTLSDKFTVVDIYTLDRPGLLYTIARFFHEQGLSIALSKINTEGARVADVFYVQNQKNQKVEDPTRLALLSTRLKEVLQGPKESMD